MVLRFVLTYGNECGRTKKASSKYGYVQIFLKRALIRNVNYKGDKRIILKRIKF